MQPIRRLVLLALAAALLAPAGARAQNPEFLPIRPPQPPDSGKKIEVIEFFWYACPHCNSLQPPLLEWLQRKPEDVEFRRVPAVLDDSWIHLARVFYALEAMGLVEKLHHRVFSAIHEERVRLQDPRVLFDWIAGQGVDRRKFEETYRSFGVQSRVRRAIELTRAYQVAGTPAIAVDGKYLTAPSLTLTPDKNVDYQRYFQVLDRVIAIARKERAGSKS
jgi:thiol:disulfide interchange protein DsbA